MPETEFVLQEPVRLSQSMLWQLQRRFFERRGHTAWGDSIVPSYITTNPFIANAYARVILGLLRDLTSASAPTPLDAAQPVYIVELGAGNGRLAFNILDSLTALLKRWPLKGVRIQYLLTDLAEKNLDFWATHPALQEWIKQGLVDFALFDTEHPAPLELVQSDRVLAPGAVTNPVVLVANYFFDSIPQDAFYVEHGQLNESLLKLTHPDREPDLEDLDLFRKLTLVYERRPAAPGDYYADPEFNRIIEEYRQELGETAVDFPNVALECLSLFRALGRDRLLLISGDKGYDRVEDLEGRKEPGYAVHGSFSMMVNYDAIGRYFANAGGDVLRTSYRYAGLNILAMLLGGGAAGYPETRLAFYEALEKQGPDDFFNLSQGIEPHLAALNLEQVIAYLRFSGWDTHIFFKCFPIMLNLVGEASERMQGEVRLAVQRLWERFYYIGQESDLPFDLGMLLFKIGDHAPALDFFNTSLQLYGPSAGTYYNQAVCLYRLDRNAEAQRAVDQALALKPEMEQAIKLRAAIIKEGQRVL